MAVNNLARASGATRGAAKLSSRDTAAYARDLLKALKVIADGQRQHRLAELLEAAAAEADRLATDKSGRQLRK